MLTNAANEPDFSSGARRTLKSASAPLQHPDTRSPSFIDRILQTLPLLSLPGRPVITVREDAIIWHGLARTLGDKRLPAEGWAVAVRQC